MRASFSALTTAALAALVYSIGDGLNQIALFANSQMMPVLANSCKLNPDSFQDGTHVCMTAQSHLKPLCDIFHIGHVIYSAGDFGLTFGGMVFIPALVIYLYSLTQTLQEKYGV